MTLPSTSTKHWIQSKTNWGVFISFTSFLAEKFDYNIGDQDGWVNVGVALVFALFAVYGRFKAIKRIK